jgi:hypothetical protein
MPHCKNNPKKTYEGTEPSPKGLGYCASGEKEGTKMKGKDGNMWIKSNGKWIKYEKDYYKLLLNKLYKWWRYLSQGGIIVIFQNNSHKLIKKIKQWEEYDKDKEIKAIIWSAMSVDIIQLFVQYLIKKSSKKQLEEFIKMKNLPDYLLENYKKYFRKEKFKSNKDYIFKK